MKLLSTVTAGVLLLAGCAPYQHGHYAADSHYINDFGDPAGTPIVTTHVGDHNDHLYEPAPVAYSEPAPIVHHSTAPVVHHPEPVHTVHHPAPAPVYIEPAPTYVQPAPPPVQQVAIAPPPPPVVIPAPAPLPIAQPEAPVHQHVEVNLHVSEKPAVVATTVNAAPEHYQHEMVYAPPAVINAPPVFVRNGQVSNRPFPAPPYPAFPVPTPAPSFGYGGYPAPFGGVVPSNVRPPYGGGCVTQCGGQTVF